MASTGTSVHREFVPYQNWPEKGDVGEYGSGGTKSGSWGTVNGQLAGGFFDKTSGADVGSAFSGALLGKVSFAWAAAFPAQPVNNEAMTVIEKKI